MTTRLVTGIPQIRQQRKEIAVANTPVQQIIAQAPWMGYIPDIDPSYLGPGACVTMSDLVARESTLGFGEMLASPPGWSQVDSARLPLKASETVGIGYFPRTDSTGARPNGTEYNETTMVIIAGDSTPGTGELWRLLQDGTWQQVSHSGHANSAALGADYPGENDDIQLHDVASAAFGMTDRDTPGITLSGTTTTEPLFIFTNHIDPVMIYPVEATPGDNDTEDGDYEILTAAFGTGVDAFRARSVEVWGDRGNFLNTIENGTTYRQRLRRTPIGNMDPDPALVGTGFIDFKQFSGDGLRVEGLGDLLACYFEDGVAVVRRSSNPVSPYQIQDINTKRGLLSTGSLVNLGDGTHFGLFNDGWFFVDSNGQFREAGMTDINGVKTNKWRRTFMNRLDIDKRHRISMQYDRVNSWVYMTLPLDGAENNDEVWIYDIDGDRVFPQSAAVTYFGESNVQISTALTFVDLDGVDGNPGPTFGDIDQTFGSFGSSYGLRTILHGNASGYVFAHDNDLTTRDGSEVPYSYKTHLSSFGSHRTYKYSREAWMQHVRKSAQGNATITMSSAPSDSGQARTLNVSVGTVGDLMTIYSGMNFSGIQLDFQLSGTGPIETRAFGADLIDTGGRGRW